MFLEPVSFRCDFATFSEVDQVVGDMASVILAVVKKFKSSRLFSELPVGHLSFGGIGTFPQCMARSENRDSYRVLLTVLQRSSGPIPKLPDLVEYDVEGVTVLGAALAYATGGLAVGACRSTPWQSGTVELRESCLVEEESGEVVVSQKRITARFAGNDGHARIHLSDLEFGFSGVSMGAVWSRRRDLLCFLEFHERVTKSIDLMQGSTFSSVIERLIELNHVMSTWGGDSGVPPAWLSKVTPESRTREELCAFNDADGVLRNYSQHARFTPGAGRIHFRLVESRKTLEIAYVGQKIGA